MTTLEDLLKRLLKEALPNIGTNVRQTNANQRNSNVPKAEIKKQYRFWDWSHGVNTTHGHAIDGSGEYKPCQKPKPGHKAEATMDNPMGGNTSRDDKAMKYWVGIPGQRGGRVVDN